MTAKIIVGLPAYNEAKNIHRLLNNIHAIKKQLMEYLEIIVINDGSSDKTEEILKNHCNNFDYMDYINHSTNLGLGCAISTLLEYVLKNCSDEDILITMDADNTHSPEIIPSMVDMLQKKNLDVVIASRFISGGKEIGLPFIRKIYSRGAMLFCKLVFHISNIRDYSCGYRAYRVGYLRRLHHYYGGHIVRSRDFECMVEILAKAGELGVRAGEYPLILQYNKKQGASKMDVSKTIIGYFRLAYSVRRSKLNNTEIYE